MQALESSQLRVEPLLARVASCMLPLRRQLAIAQLPTARIVAAIGDRLRKRQPGASEVLAHTMSMLSFDEGAHHEVRAGCRGAGCGRCLHIGSHQGMRPLRMIN
eukprot:13858595-Heterocapsa_arctica.AAC.2